MGLVHDLPIVTTKVPACGSSGNTFVSGARGVRFKSQAGQIGQSVASGSAPLRHFFGRSCAVRWRSSLHSSAYNTATIVEDLNFIPVVILGFTTEYVCGKKTVQRLYCIPGGPATSPIHSVVSHLKFGFRSGRTTTSKWTRVNKMNQEKADFQTKISAQTRLVVPIAKFLPLRDKTLFRNSNCVA